MAEAGLHNFIFYDTIWRKKEKWKKARKLIWKYRQRIDECDKLTTVSGRQRINRGDVQQRNRLITAYYCNRQSNISKAMWRERTSWVLTYEPINWGRIKPSISNPSIYNKAVGEMAAAVIWYIEHRGRITWNNKEKVFNYKIEESEVMKHLRGRLRMEAESENILKMLSSICGHETP